MYFVTVCTHDSVPLLASRQDLEMRVSPAGLMVSAWWSELGRRFSEATPLEIEVMPDHIHGIIELDSGRTGPALPGVLGWFKSMTTNEYIRGVRAARWPSFSRKLWQRGYYEHVVRDEDDLARVREYMHDNPLKWVVHRYEGGRFAG